MSSISSETATDLTRGDGSLAYSSADDPIVGGLRRSTWLQIGIIAALFAAIYWPNLRRLWLKTNPFTGDGNWSHSVFVPLIGLYYLYVNRETILATPVKTAWSGLGIIIGGLVLSMFSVWPLRNDFFWDFGMVTVLFGVVLFMCGWGMMRIVWFPLVFLLCALPWPGLIYSEVASPLQVLAAKVAAKVLEFTGVDAGVTGTKIIMAVPPSRGGGFYTLNVAEACAGMRSLMTFISLAGAVAFLSSRPLWQKLFIMLSAIPIAIFCNVMRVCGQGLLHYYVKPELSEGFAHAFVGMVMLIPAFFLLLGVAWVLDHLFIEEVDETTRRKVTAARAAKIVIPQRGATAALVSPAAAPVTAPAVVHSNLSAPAVKPISRPTVGPAAAAGPKPATAAPQMKIPPRPGTAGITNRPVPVRRPPQGSSSSSDSNAVNPIDPGKAQ